MRKLIYFCLLIGLTLNLKAQKNDLIPNMYSFKLLVDGINDSLKADYLARALEKQNLVLFASFSQISDYGYIIVSDKSQISNVASYINLTLNNYKLLEYEELPLTQNLFLEIYSLRSNNANNICKNLPKYIQLGPKNELSWQLYDLAKSIWIEKCKQEDNSSKDLSY